MAAEKKKVYGNMRIMAIEGKDIFRADTLTALKNGKLNADRFGGIIDESLDTDKLCEVYKAHEAEIGYPYTDIDSSGRVSYDVTRIVLDDCSQTKTEIFVTL